MTAPSTLTEPELDATDRGKDGDVFHYMRKGDIAESAVLGTCKRTLCGIYLSATQVPGPNPRICHECKEIYESLS